MRSKHWTVGGWLHAPFWTASFHWSYKRSTRPRDNPSFFSLKCSFMRAYSCSSPCCKTCLKILSNYYGYLEIGCKTPKCSKSRRPCLHLSGKWPNHWISVLIPVLLLSHSLFLGCDQNLIVPSIENLLFWLEWATSLFHFIAFLICSQHW